MKTKKLAQDEAPGKEKIRFQNISINRSDSEERRAGSQLVTPSINAIKKNLEGFRDRRTEN
jgi:hypothetical protein